MIVGKKIYFLADVHLGSGTHAYSRERERKLCRWLDSVKQEAEAIYLLGDIFDYWYEYRYVVPKGFTRILGKLSELTDSGVEVHFFIGNHDIWLTDYLAEECGMMLHFEPFITEIGGKRFFLAHGDGLGEESRSVRLMRRAFHSRFLRRCFSAIHPRWTIPMAHRWSDSSRAKGGVADFLGEERELLVLFSKKKLKEQPDINYFIYGHRHILLELPIGEQSDIIILGDWISYFSFAVFNGESVTLERAYP